MDPKLAKWAKEAAEKDQKWPSGKLDKAKALAEKLKDKDAEKGGKGGVGNPHALARWAVARGEAVKKGG